MPQYTEEIHAERLLEMLELENPCSHCPAQVKFGVDGDFIEDANLFSSTSDERIGCKVCRNFINMKSTGCPCPMLGKKKALKRTLEALKKKGYLSTTE